MKQKILAPWFIGHSCLGDTNEAPIGQDITGKPICGYLSRVSASHDSQYDIDPVSTTFHVSLSRRLSGGAFMTLLALLYSYEQKNFLKLSCKRKVFIAAANDLKELLGRSNSGKTSEALEKSLIELSETSMLFEATDREGHKRTIIESPLITHFENGKLSIDCDSPFPYAVKDCKYRDRTWRFSFGETLLMGLKRLRKSDDPGDPNNSVITMSVYDLAELNVHRSNAIDLPLKAHFQALDMGNPHKVMDKKVLTLLTYIGFSAKALSRISARSIQLRITSAIRRSKRLIITEGATFLLRKVSYKTT